jgi:hypothetical protein
MKVFHRQDGTTTVAGFSSEFAARIHIFGTSP